MGQQQQQGNAGSPVPPEHRAELCKRCIPQVESILGNAGNAELAPTNAVNAAGDTGNPGSPHVQQLAIPPGAAQFLVNLAIQVGMPVLQQAVDAIKAELEKLTNAPTAQPGV